jgi:hypothetical protein
MVDIRGMCLCSLSATMTKAFRKKLGKRNDLPSNDLPSRQIQLARQARAYLSHELD